MKSNTMFLDKHKVLLAMADNGYSMKDFCIKANIHYSTYRRMINGNKLSTETIGKIAKALNVKVEELI